MLKSHSESPGRRERKTKHSLWDYSEYVWGYKWVNSLALLSFNAGYPCLMPTKQGSRSLAYSSLFLSLS